MSILKVFFRGTIALLVILLGVFLVVLPAKFAAETGNNNWLLLEIPLIALPIITILGLLFTDDEDDKDLI